ncbi:anti-sigma factor [Pseudomonas tolaasii]|uniref:Anti-sigma factor n=2 Tax=Pseudomonas tolaasii TaxID=29442 RepID=A0A7Y8AII4_PSETO|nr:anti-sigma factor [Pseudomonas tolaasii]ARB25880.1 anti-sigma factor [Pseudomonas tolaasii]KAB0476821.1 anti-sigma factor [Pseudomonas tolaasii]MBW1245760.1 anti-sigma factor [Pseudomonas tolaasii]MBY8938531.1 anti-sigma factor [Pseudomonas tolaasii]NWC20892.1 anti-sigma factor [Pseudomonas tolaasii]
MNYQTTALRRALAADYAIGLMPATARKRFEHLLLDDAALRIELGHWQDALASLTGTLPERPVPDHVWAGIKARIEPQVLHVPAKKPFWMNFRLLAAACAVVLALFVGVLYQRENTAQYNATLVNASQQPALRIQAFADYLQVEPLTLAALEPARVLELWAIPAGGKPISLGLVPDAGKGRIQLSKEQQALLTAPLTLAVSLEPQGGSPTGQPTGPVLYQGALATR